jgi:DNA-binding HxlR family transcriptional regulator
MKTVDTNDDAPLGLAALAQQPITRRNCAIADALAILGERWTFLAVREMSYGAHRFDQIAGFTGASRDILADRLRTLVANGIVEQRQYSEHPPRFEYHLTESGQDLVPILISIGAWGAKWIGTEQPRRGFAHRCGHTLEIDHVCASCREPIRSSDLVVKSN